MSFISWLRSRRLKNEAMSEASAGRLRQAVPLLREYVRRNPRDAEAMYRLADSEAHLGNSDEAERWYRDLLGLLPDHAEAKEGLALAMAERRLADVASAVRLIEEIRPDYRRMGLDDFICLDLAWVHHLGGDNDTARRHLDQAREHGIVESLAEVDRYYGGIEFSEAHYRLGILLAILGEDREKAAHHLRRGLDLSPESTYAREAVRLLAEHGEKDG